MFKSLSPTVLFLLPVVAVALFGWEEPSRIAMIIALIGSAALGAYQKAITAKEAN